MLLRIVSHIFHHQPYHTALPGTGLQCMTPTGPMRHQLPKYLPNTTGPRDPPPSTIREKHLLGPCAGPDMYKPDQILLRFPFSHLRTICKVYTPKQVLCSHLSSSCPLALLPSWPLDLLTSWPLDLLTSWPCVSWQKSWLLVTITWCILPSPSISTLFLTSLSHLYSKTPLVLGPHPLVSPVKYN
jgi:hypothetical protein